MKPKDIDIRALADLARLRISDEERAELEKEIPDILAFVEEIQGVETAKQERDVEHRGVMREDEEPHESGMYTDDLLNAAPVTERGRIKVKQVLKK